MNRFEQIHALLESADESLLEIERLYNSSLSSKELDPQLLVRIKNLLENLRSSLEYLAQEIFNRYCRCPRGKHISVYFPILSKTSTPQDFASFMNGRFPGLAQARPSLYSKLESYQYFHSATNEWLIQFNELCQQNKHEQLTPQIRKEEKRTRITDSAGRTVSWTDGVQFGRDGTIVLKPGGKLILGPGGSVELGPTGASVLGRPIDPRKQIPQGRPQDKIERITWVDFQFSSIGVSALPFMKTCTSRVRAMVREIQDEIEGISSP